MPASLMSHLARHGLPALLAAALMLGAGPAAAAEDGKAGKQAQAGGEDKPAPVVVDRVVEQPLNQTVPVLGRLVARQAGPVAARIGGPVEVITVEVGDSVTAGDVLASLVKDSFEWQVKLQESRVAEAEARLDTAKAEAGLLRQEVARLERLRKSAAFSQAKLEDKRQELVKARSAIAEAEANLMSAKAELRLAQIDFHITDIRAPYDGTVTERHTEAGAYVTVGAPVVSLVNDTRLELEADVPADRTPALRPGTPVSFTLNGDQSHPARVRAVVPEENPQTRTRTVRFRPDLPDDGARLATNQTVVISIPAGAADAVVTVSKDAVLNRRGKTLVYLVEDGKAVLRPVELDEAVQGRFRVRSGLQPGDEVVVRGNERLRPGQSVKVRKAPEG